MLKIEDLHVSYGGIRALRKLGINLTCEPAYQTKKLYHK